MSDQRILFTKSGTAKYISHLDLMHTMERAFLRAGITIRHTAGFHPHPYVSIPLPLPLDEDGFVMGGEEAGIFAAGCARMPLDVMRTAQSGTAAALKAVQTVKGR